MASTGFTGGPWKLDNASIDAVVIKKSPGAYALGSDEPQTFVISYVGRSDDDLNARLKQHVGKYSHFKCGYLPNALEAFKKECHLFHDFGGGANTNHPARPAGSNEKCPVCGA